MKYNITFIAQITDIVERRARTFQVASSPRVNVYDGEVKTVTRYKAQYDNPRWAIYCPCNTRLEVDIQYLHVLGRGTLKPIAPIVCSCGREYKDGFEARQIAPKLPSKNTVEKRFSLVERANSFALYTFGTYVLVSSTTHKLVFKDIGDYSLYISKKKKAVQIRKGGKVITVPMKRLTTHVVPFIQYLMGNALTGNYMTDGLFQKKVLTPLEKFCEVVESMCHTNDVARINQQIVEARNNFYLSNLFADKKPSYFKLRDHDYHFAFEHNENYRLDRCVAVQYLTQRLCTMLALYIYPAYATIALTYGYEKLLRILSDNSLICSLTQLKKKSPTKPKEIIEHLIKAKMQDDNIKFRKLKAAEEKTEKKTKTTSKEESQSTCLY